MQPQDDSDLCPPAMSSLLYSEPYKIAPPTGRLHLQSMNLWGTFPIQAVKRISSIFLSDMSFPETIFQCPLICHSIGSQASYNLEDTSF